MYMYMIKKVRQRYSILITTTLYFTQVECCCIDHGDVVRVCDDMATVHQLQSGHGEWTGDMALVLIITMNFC